MTVSIIENEKKPVTLQDTYDAWHKLKMRYYDALVMIRNGDNYYAFEGDAVIVTRLVQKEPIPFWKERELCILPHYEIDTFLRAAIKGGYRAAVCEPVFLSLFQ